MFIKETKVLICKYKDSVHELVVHGINLIDFFVQMPTAQLSGEPLESIHKIFRKIGCNTHVRYQGKTLIR